EDLDRINTHLDSFLKRSADTSLHDDIHAFAWDWDSILERLADTNIYIRTVNQIPLIVRCRALDVIESNTTVIGDYVDWSPLLGSLPIKPSDRFEMGLARHFAEKFALEGSLEVED